MRRWFFKLWLLWLPLAAGSAFADGGFVPSTAFASVKIPDQRALIHFANGTETLVIDTAFKGDGTNFAWIVPVPSVPTVEPATAGLFTTLQTIFQPRVIHDAGDYYWPALILGGLIFCKIRQRRHGGTWLGVLLFCLFLLLMAGLLLPALGTAGVSISTSGVHLIERKTVGVYDTATVSCGSGEELLTWLNQNGFATPTNFLPAIQAYAQEGWTFVVSKIRVDLPMNEPARPHPLSFTFKTERPVYPLRLTGIGNEKCRIDLYVFGAGEASVPHFEVERCAAPSYPDEEKDVSYRNLDVMRIRHPLLRKLVDNALVATKLTGELNSHDMEQDGYITWSALREKRLTLYTSQGASETAANIVVPILVLICMLWYALKEREAAWAKGFCRLCVKTVLLALVAWPVILFSLPTTPAFLARMPAFRNAVLHREWIPSLLEDEFTNSQQKIGPNFKPDLTWVRQELLETSPLRRDIPNNEQTNFFTGQPWREEDSPGNYTLRQTNDEIEYTWYDIDGGPHALTLFKEKKEE